MNRRSFWDRRLPPLVSLFVLIFSIGITGWFVGAGIIFTGRAAGGDMPQDVSVTNVTDHSFTVSFVTTNAVLGTVSYSVGQESTIAGDERDQRDGQARQHTIHSIVVQNLTPDTTYSYTITSGSKTITDNGKPFVIHTGAHLAPTEKVNPVTGKVITENGDPPSEGIVYITPNGGQTLSALIASDGSYTIPLDDLRDSSLQSHLTLTDDQQLSLRVAAAEGSANVKMLAARIHPVATITLNNAYDFSVQNVRTTTAVASDSGDIVSFPVLSDTGDTSQKSVRILSPKENQSLIDQKPVFKGTTSPNTEVDITITASTELQANVISDSRGNWSYRPKTPLSPGKHTVTISSRNAAGILKVVTTPFTVFAAGSLFTEPSVSPPKKSPTPTPVKKKRPTPTATEAPSPTEKPTKRVSTPTSIPTSMPTAVPTQIPTRIPTIQPTIVTQPTAVPTLIQTGPTRMLPPQHIATSPRPSIAPTGSNDVLVYGLIGTLTLALGAVIIVLAGI